MIQTELYACCLQHCDADNYVIFSWFCRIITWRSWWNLCGCHLPVIVAGHWFRLMTSVHLLVLVHIQHRIVIAVERTTFMVLPSWQCLRENSRSSFNECRTALSGWRRLDWLVPLVLAILMQIDVWVMLISLRRVSSLSVCSLLHCERALCTSWLRQLPPQSLIFSATRSRKVRTVIVCWWMTATVQAGCGYSSRQRSNDDMMICTRWRRPRLHCLQSTVWWWLLRFIRLLNAACSFSNRLRGWLSSYSTVTHSWKCDGRINKNAVSYCITFIRCILDEQTYRLIS